MGNGTAAVRELEPEYLDPEARSTRITAKSSDTTIQEYLEDSLQQIGESAVQRVEELVQSCDERIATKNSHYVIDHLRGKAVQRSINVSTKLNIQSVLD